MKYFFANLISSKRQYYQAYLKFRKGLILKKEQISAPFSLNHMETLLDHRVEFQILF
jgi:hypothetical protein